MKELTRRLAGSTGIGVKVVERNGSSLKSFFSLNNLWDGGPCGRTDCIPCNQGAEEPPKCTKASLVYEQAGAELGQAQLKLELGFTLT